MAGNGMNRRAFMKASAAAAVVTSVGSSVAPSRQVFGADGLDHRNERPDRMRYRELGRTKFNCSRLVFGCGAALAGGKAVRLLERAFEAGINHYDVGYDDYYKGSEKNLAAFANRHKGEVWITSKAPARMESGAELTVERAKAAAEYWSRELDKSLERLETDYVDAYYVMGASDPALLKSEELAQAFFTARDAGKVGHWGISTHHHAQECLEACIETGWYSLAMIAITPAGWYDYNERKLLGTGSMKELRPVLDRAREAGIGLVGMKAARFIATNPYGGKYGRVAEDSVVSTFDPYYDEAYMKNDLSPYQRSYAFVLEHGLDVVNADMQNFKHFEENLVAARTSHEYFA